MKVLVTGAAGFIGSTLTHRLLDRGDEVVGIDDLNDYYDVRLKQSRLDRLNARERFSHVLLDIVERKRMEEIFAAEQFDAVMHLAAQAGVRYSIENPSAYIDSNIVGFNNILEGCRHTKVGHLVYASSSSVYGANTNLPFSEHHNVDHPVSLYAATKKANELMAHSYAHLYGLPCTGLRFFTVYGPWGRPDMALFKFTAGILSGRPIQVFNHGEMVRDFYLRRRHCRGDCTCYRLASPARSGVEWRSSGPRDKQRTMARLQHRQQQSGKASPLYRSARTMSRPQGYRRAHANAAWRRTRDHRRRQRSQTGN